MIMTTNGSMKKKNKFSGLPGGAVVEGEKKGLIVITNSVDIL